PKDIGPPQADNAVSIISENEPQSGVGCVSRRFASLFGLNCNKKGLKPKISLYSALGGAESELIR
ncbi:MAG: hypothetical protein LUH47_07075, partial [Clostridiales bacterium]|nr:hypothetical protein [Clostridiales bacterium]